MVDAGDPLGKGQKAPGAADDPCFGIAFEERAVLGGILESGMLPPGPATPEDESRSLVVGEAHHPNEIWQVSRPQWLVIPEPGICTGIAI